MSLPNLQGWGSSSSSEQSLPPKSSIWNLLNLLFLILAGFEVSPDESSDLQVLARFPKARIVSWVTWFSWRSFFEISTLRSKSEYIWINPWMTSIEDDGPYDSGWKSPESGPITWHMNILYWIFFPCIQKTHLCSWGKSPSSPWNILISKCQVPINSG